MYYIFHLLFEGFSAYRINLCFFFPGIPAPAVHTAPVAQTAAPAPVRTQATAAPAKAAGAGRAVTAPLPGVIIEVSVSAGQTVKAGQKVAVLEAMKMENEIQAEKDGTVTAIHVAKGDSVLEGAKIVTIA